MGPHLIRRLHLRLFTVGPCRGHIGKSNQSSNQDADLNRRSRCRHSHPSKQSRYRDGQVIIKGNKIEIPPNFQWPLGATLKLQSIP